MNYISWSLYGRDAKYGIGACKNAVLSKHWYPLYQMIFWVTDDVPEDVVDYLKEFGAIVNQVKLDKMGGMFHRFLVNDLPDCERYLIRDTDSRINEREVIAVREWEKSGKPFHVIRDHPHHATDILGGVWGATRQALGPIMESLINKWDGVKEGYDADQEFLRKVIWPRVRHRTLQHDSCTRHLYPDAVPVPVTLTYDNPRFCCEVFDHLDRPRAYDWERMLMSVPREKKQFGDQCGVEGHASTDEASAPRGMAKEGDSPSQCGAERGKLAKPVSIPATDRQLKGPLFIRPHLGLGDALIVNGLVRTKAAIHSEVIFPSKKENLATVTEMFSDCTNVRVDEVADDKGADVCASICENVLRLGMFNPKWNGGKPGWDKLMYEQAGVPWEQRWEGFKAGITGWRRLSIPLKQFALIHDDPSRKFEIPRERLPKIPIVWVGPSESLFDYVPFIWEATEIHCIDSCVAILADSIQTVAKKLMLHLYARPNAKPPTFKKAWEILKK